MQWHRLIRPGTELQLALKHLRADCRSRIWNGRPYECIQLFLPFRWNFTPSPGWTREEVGILRLCLMKYGVGRWVQILDTGLLPGKLIQQLNGQTQRLLGQQSLAGKLSCKAIKAALALQSMTCKQQTGQQGLWHGIGR